MSTYYYGDSRRLCRYPPEVRCLRTELPLMQLVAREDTQSLRTALSRQTGYKGLSILHRFNALYGFDVINDLVFDAMHNLPLNVARQHLKRYAEEKLVDFKELDRRLQLVPWTAGLFRNWSLCILCACTLCSTYYITHRVEIWSVTQPHIQTNGILGS